MARVDFDPVAHTYTVAGRRVWSVTNALSVVTNFDRVPIDVLEAARIFGHHVHKAVHLHTLGTLHEPSLSPAIAVRLGHWKQFLFDTKYQIEHSEQIVLDSAQRYCGTLDSRGRWHSRGRSTSALVDLKSGAVPKTVGPQTAGYQQACTEKPRLRFALQLREHDYRLIALNEQADFSHFLSCLNVFKLSMKGNPYEKQFDDGRKSVDTGVDPDSEIDPKLAEHALSTHRSMLAVTVTCAEDSAQAQGSLAEIKKRIESLTEMRMAITRPMDAAKRLVMDLFAVPLMRYEQAADHLQRQVVTYTKKAEDEARAAQKKLDDAAEAKRLSLIKKADAAVAAGDSTKANKLLDRADAVVAPVVAADLPKVKGSGVVKRWAFRIKDESKVLMLIPDTVRIGKAVRALGMDAQKVVGEGVEIYEDRSVRSW